MRDTVDELDCWGRHLHRRSRSNPLRAELQAVLDRHGDVDDPIALRRSIGGGTPLADLVDEGRDERGNTG